MGLLSSTYANILEYNYYAEIHDGVETANHLANSVHSLTQLFLRNQGGYDSNIFDVAAEEASYWLNGAMFEHDFATWSAESMTDALFGKCKPFAGYDDTFINMPTVAVFDANFWCLHVA